METTITRNQKRSLGPFKTGENEYLTVSIRFDDECGNGHNTLAITGEIKTGRGKWISGGCLHDEIAKLTDKQLSKYGLTTDDIKTCIELHLCSTDGPLHYISNTMHLAGDKDCWGRRKGEPSNFDHVVYFGDSPISHKVKKGFWDFLKERCDGAKRPEFHVVAIVVHDRDRKTYGDYYTFVGFAEKWHECPFRKKQDAMEWSQAFAECDVTFEHIPTEFSEGKKREIESAQRAACWPNATVEQLTSKEALENHLVETILPKLQSIVEKLGFQY